MSLKWPRVVQKKGTLKRIESYGDDIRPIVEYTHTFIFITPEGRADERQDLFYTALAPTPEEAETAAQMVYIRAVECQHEMVQIKPRLTECTQCGIQQRIMLRAPVYDLTSPKPEEPKKPQKQSKGFFSFFKKK